MLAAILFALTASLTTGAKGKFASRATADVGTVGTPMCIVDNRSNDCETYYTGPQCSAYFGGNLKLLYEFPFPAGPLCVTPLRQYQP